MNTLPLFLKLAGRPVAVIGDGPAAEAKRRLVARAGARIVDDEAAAVPLAIVAVEDAADAARIADAFRARGTLVNVVDHPALCDFYVPAIVDRAPVTVAIGTGGASASLAKTIRRRIEALLPAYLGGLARGLHAARPAIRARWPDEGDRRRALDAGMVEGAPLDPLAPDLAEDGAARVIAWLSDFSGDVAAARLVPLRIASPDPEELTLRAHRLLGMADRIYHRANISSAILDRARADAQRIECAAPPAAPPPGLSLDLAYS